MNSSRLKIACLSVVLAGAALAVRGQPFGVGSIVTTNFGLQNRFRWTNDNGQVFTPSNTTIRLNDFEGKILFAVFFDVW